LKLHFVWASRARAELRRTQRETAVRILIALTRYAETGEGDIKALEGKFTKIKLALCRQLVANASSVR
jgi:hypothetical protein